MKSYALYLQELTQIEKSHAAGWAKDHELFCFTGDWMDCAVLKLQKKSWTTGGMGEGVFFSVWLGEKEINKRLFRYNIHAYKLRTRPGYAIKPREFADCFRAGLATFNEPWPNLSIDYGPQNLMQGWSPLISDSFNQDVLKLVQSFVALHPLIDRMLDERRIPG